MYAQAAGTGNDHDRCDIGDEHCQNVLQSEGNGLYDKYVTILGVDVFHGLIFCFKHNVIFLFLNCYQLIITNISYRSVSKIAREMVRKTIASKSSGEFDSKNTSFLIH